MDRLMDRLHLARSLRLGSSARGDAGEGHVREGGEAAGRHGRGRRVELDDRASGVGAQTDAPVPAAPARGRILASDDPDLLARS
jgi:hypothetical protein